jgi:hypothetical protein
MFLGTVYAATLCFKQNFKKNIIIFLVELLKNVLILILYKYRKIIAKNVPP